MKMGKLVVFSKLEGAPEKLSMQKLCTVLFNSKLEQVFLSDIHCLKYFQHAMKKD